MNLEACRSEELEDIGKWAYWKSEAVLWRR